MGDDIVTRLRAAARSGDLPLGVSFDCDAVADEIERLRGLLDQEQQRRRDDLLGQQHRDDEIERLRAAGDALAATWPEEDRCNCSNADCRAVVAAVAAWKEARRG